MTASPQFCPLMASSCCLGGSPEVPERMGESPFTSCKEDQQDVTGLTEFTSLQRGGPTGCKCRERTGGARPAHLLQL